MAPPKRKKFPDPEWVMVSGIVATPLVPKELSKVPLELNLAAANPELVSPSASICPLVSTPPPHAPSVAEIVAVEVPLVPNAESTVPLPFARLTTNVLVPDPNVTIFPSVCTTDSRPEPPPTPEVPKVVSKVPGLHTVMLELLVFPTESDTETTAVPDDDEAT